MNTRTSHRNIAGSSPSGIPILSDEHIILRDPGAVEALLGRRKVPACAYLLYIYIILYTKYLEHRIKLSFVDYVCQIMEPGDSAGMQLQGVMHQVLSR